MSDRRRRRARLELWLGLLVIVSAVLLTWGYFWLTGRPLGERGYDVVVEIEHAEGLERGAQVRLNGVDVGTVQSIDLTPDRRVFAAVRIEHAVRLPRDSRALLASAGVFGNRYIALDPGRADELITEGDTLVAREAPSLVDMAGAIGDEARSVLLRLERLLADTTIEQAQGSVAAMEGAVRGLEELVSRHGDEFAAMSRSLARTAETLERSLGDPRTDEAVEDLQRTAAELSEAADALKRSSRSLASISEKIDQGEGTLGLLVNDPSLYEELQSTVHSITALTRDIRENPGRYVNIKIF